MYVDDGIVVDLQDAKGAAQVAVRRFFQRVGAPLAVEFPKHRPMSKACDFLGMEHSFAQLAEKQAVPFRPREGLREKLRA